MKLPQRGPIRTRARAARDCPRGLDRTGQSRIPTSCSGTRSASIMCRAPRIGRYCRRCGTNFNSAHPDSSRTIRFSIYHPRSERSDIPNQLIEKIKLACFKFVTLSVSCRSEESLTTSARLPWSANLDGVTLLDGGRKARRPILSAACSKLLRVRSPRRSHPCLFIGPAFVVRHHEERRHVHLAEFPFAALSYVLVVVAPRDQTRDAVENRLRFEIREPMSRVAMHMRRVVMHELLDVTDTQGTLARFRGRHVHRAEKLDKLLAAPGLAERAEIQVGVRREQIRYLREFSLVDTLVVAIAQVAKSLAIGKFQHLGLEFFEARFHVGRHNQSSSVTVWTAPHLGGSGQTL